MEARFRCNCGLEFGVKDNGQNAIKLICPRCKKEVIAERIEEESLSNGDGK